MSKHRLELMFLDELEAEIAHTGIAYVPCGASEWHGPQLAVGCDYLRAGPICERAAAQTGGVVLPPVWVAAPGNFDYHGSLFFSGELVKRFASELMRELEKLGFRLVVFLLGHGGAVQQECFEEAVARHQGTLKGLVINSGLVDIPPEWAAHAGPWETAECMACEPAAVDLSRYQPDDPVLPKYDLPDSGPYKRGLSQAAQGCIDKWTARTTWPWVADLPERVTPEQAEAWLAEESNNVAELVRKAASGQ